MKVLEHILIIDDNEEDNEFHELIVRDTGVAKKFTSIKEPEKAISFLKSCLGDAEGALPVPELMFLDTMMPRIDGFELLETLLPELMAYNAQHGTPKIFMLSGAWNPQVEKLLKDPNYKNLVVGSRIKPLTKKMMKEIMETWF